MAYNEPDLASPAAALRLAPSVAVCNYVGSAPPTPVDDTVAGYQENSLWYIPADERLFLCVDPSEGVAVWIELQTGEDVEPPPPILPPRFNAALAANGSIATATSFGAGLDPNYAINGQRYPGTWGAPGSGWQSAPGLPQTHTVDFGTMRKLSEIDLYFLADAVNYTTTPKPGDVGTNYIAKDFTVEYYDGSSWQLVATVTGNTFVFWQYLFPTPTNASAIRTTIAVAYVDAYARIIEVEAWVGEAGTGTPGRVAYFETASSIGSANHLDAVGGEALKIMSRPWLVPSCLQVKPAFDGGTEYYGANHNDAFLIDGTGSQFFGRYGGGSMNLIGVVAGSGINVFSISPWGSTRSNFRTINWIDDAPAPSWGNRYAFNANVDSRDNYYPNSDIDVLRVSTEGASFFGYYTGKDICMIRAEDDGTGQYFQVWRYGRTNVRKALAVGPGVAMDNTAPAATIDATDATGLDQLQIGYDSVARLRFNVNAAGGTVIEPFGTVPSISICPDPSTHPFSIFGATPTGQQSVNGSRSDPEQALASLIAALAAFGWIGDYTTP